MVTVVDNGTCITVNANSSTQNIAKVKVYIRSEDNFVIIGYDEDNYLQFPYTDFASPSGADADAVASQIAAFLNT